MQAVRNWLAACPALQGLVPGQDYLGPDAVSLSVDAVPTARISRRYHDGARVQQLSFALAVRTEYGADGAGQAEAEQLLEAAAAYLTSGALPTLPEGCTPLRAELTSSGYLAGAEPGSARYELQGRLIYVAEAGTPG